MARSRSVWGGTHPKREREWLGEGLMGTGHCLVQSPKSSKKKGQRQAQALASSQPLKNPFEFSQGITSKA